MSTISPSPPLLVSLLVSCPWLRLQCPSSEARSALHRRLLSGDGVVFFFPSQRYHWALRSSTSGTESPADLLLTNHLPSTCYSSFLRLQGPRSEAHTALTRRLLPRDSVVFFPPPQRYRWVLRSLTSVTTLPAGLMTDPSFVVRIGRLTLDGVVVFFPPSTSSLFDFRHFFDCWSDDRPIFR